MWSNFPPNAVDPPYQWAELCNQILQHLVPSINRLCATCFQQMLLFLYFCVICDSISKLKVISFKGIILDFLNFIQDTCSWNESVNNWKFCKQPALELATCTAFLLISNTANVFLVDFVIPSCVPIFQWWVAIHILKGIKMEFLKSHRLV